MNKQLDQKIHSQNFNESLKNTSLYTLFKRISNRGPNYSSVKKLTTIRNNNLEEIKLEIYENFNSSNLFELIESIKSEHYQVIISSVLGLRGIKNLTKQPILYKYVNSNKVENLKIDDISNSKNFLLYNGEIFKIKEDIKMITTSIEKRNTIELVINQLQIENDGLLLSNILQIFSEEYYLNYSQDDENTNDKYSNLFFKAYNSLESDHAFIYYDNLNKKIIANRDIFGKRSLLLVHFIRDNLFLFSSNISFEIYDLIKKFPDEISIMELPANAVVLMDLKNLDLNLKFINDEKYEKKDVLHLFLNPYIKYPSQFRFKNKIYEGKNLFIT